jgi:glycerol-3-phosphate acyltransferase PlsY
MNYALALGVAAVMGHLFPIFAGFRGGKGVATLFGMILAIHLHAALLCVLVFVVVLLLTKYVSLSSIAAAFTYPIGVSFVFPTSIRSVCNLWDVYLHVNIGNPPKKYRTLIKGHRI